ncbi:acetyl-CoA C-acyltransferase [Actinokineospora sp. PR83]|uniref:acetyl-CoA C-acyltransferase n=1 Tax=Actinokineospora sp. PR83 TaxID=2884908 RepID=UPI001F258793|nr:acetyl-CoA C-acyltransferase [Actinokineospora sp. PR83]MCG8918048.1 acetyl-CoA C-acyltransferase [Actinokineospora sp. PR83]
MGDEVYLLDYVRTPLGRGRPGGGLHRLSPLDLVSGLLRALAARAPALDPGRVDDVVLGCAAQVGEQGGNPARTATLLAGWGDRVPGATVNRSSVSGLDAVTQAAARIRAGEADLVVAGGVESPSRVAPRADRAPQWDDAELVRRTGAVHPGVAADLTATLDGFTREDLDAYAAASHRRAAAVTSPSLVPFAGLARDELVDGATSAAVLARLPPAYAALGANGQDALALAGRGGPVSVEHVHTAATSAAPADGAALLLVGSARAAHALGRAPRARVVASALVAGDPATAPFTGPAAMAEVLRRARFPPDRMAVLALAEVFAAPCLRVRRDFDAGPDRLNPAGGELATGHAAGAAGAIVLGGLLESLERAGGRLGVAGIGGGAGLGAAVLLDRG